MNTKRQHGAAAIAGLLIWLLATAASGAVPEGIDYQGYLTNTDGSSITGEVSMSFVAYNVDFGGAPLWNQTATVTVDQGLFSITLGSPVNPFPAGLFDGPVYLGLFVGGEELLPRRMLSSAAYAFKASDADSLGGSAPAAFNQSAHVTDMGNPHGVTAAQAGAASVTALASLTGDVTALGQDIAAVETSAGANASDIAALVATVNALQATVASLQTDLVDANATIASLQTDVSAIEGNSVLALDGILTMNGGDTARFSGVNVQVVNGTGTTDGAPNALGNLIVGYNTAEASGLAFCSLGEFLEQAACLSGGGTWSNSHKSGSHNVVIGDRHSYSRHSGLVLGENNDITGIGASVTGGTANLAAALGSTVSGGVFNNARGVDSSISGGANNVTAGSAASISGGRNSIAFGDYASVSGGSFNTASGSSSSVSGGSSNTASGDRSSVSGRSFNTASGSSSSVSGGSVNEASGEQSSIGGGGSNSATQLHSSVSGGSFNVASGTASSVGGGAGSNSSLGNTASGAYSRISGGRRNVAFGLGSSVSGGNSNVAGGVDSSVAGGFDNSVSTAGSYGTVAGGQRAVVSGNYATVSGGSQNTASGVSSVVGGGLRNSATATWSSVSGGADRDSTGEADWRAGTLFENF